MKMKLTTEENDRRLKTFNLKLSYAESAKLLGLHPKAYRTWVYRQRLTHSKMLHCPKHGCPVRTTARKHKNTQQAKHYRRPDNYQLGYVYCTRCAEKGSGWLKRKLAVRKRDILNPLDRLLSGTLREKK